MFLNGIASIKIPKELGACVSVNVGKVTIIIWDSVLAWLWQHMLAFTQSVLDSGHAFENEAIPLKRIELFCSKKIHSGFYIFHYCKSISYFVTNIRYSHWKGTWSSSNYSLYHIFTIYLISNWLRAVQAKPTSRDCNQCKRSLQAVDAVHCTVFQGIQRV